MPQVTSAGSISNVTDGDAPFCTDTTGEESSAVGLAALLAAGTSTVAHTIATTATTLIDRDSGRDANVGVCTTPAAKGLDRDEMCLLDGVNRRISYPRTCGLHRNVTWPGCAKTLTDKPTVGPAANAPYCEPMRIVSLLPSATEILFALGVGDQVVGVTFECDHPPAARTKTIVSTSALPEGLTPGEIDAVVKQRIADGEDLYRLDRNAFTDINPDLVVTQDLCAVCAVDVTEVDDALAYLACNATVLTLDPMRLGDVLATVTTVAAATGTTEVAAELVAALQHRLDAVASAVAGAGSGSGDVATPRSVLMLEWCDPAFTAGHWVPDLVTAAGGTPVLAEAGAKSVGVTWEAVADANAEVVVVSPCGFGLDGAADQAQKLVDADRLPHGAEVWAIDADAFIVRPGPRVVDGAETLASILHPQRCGPPAPDRAQRIA